MKVFKSWEVADKNTHINTLDHQIILKSGDTVPLIDTYGMTQLLNELIESAPCRQRSILSSVRGFLVVLALSVHSLFEGMAIGEH